MLVCFRRRVARRQLKQEFRCQAAISRKTWAGAQRSRPASDQSNTNVGGQLQVRKRDPKDGSTSPPNYAR